MQTPLLQSALDRWPVHRGKVRDIYDLGDRLLLVATDRISAFDWVLPTGIPDKGRVLTQTSLFWLELLDEPNHLLSADVADFDLPPDVDPDLFAGRSMLVRKAKVVPIECVVRGYLSGSGWKEYRQSGDGLRREAAGRIGRERQIAAADFHSRHEGRNRPRHQHLARADARIGRRRRGR